MSRDKPCKENNVRFTAVLCYSFNRSKYFHLLIAPIEGFIRLDNEREIRKIYVTAKIFLLVQN